MPLDELAAAFAAEAEPGNGKLISIDEADWERRMREAVASGHLDPEALPGVAETLRGWARFVAAMPQVEREVAISERLAVMAPLYGNAGEMLRAALDEAMAARRPAGDDQGDTLAYIDWEHFWATDHTEEEWLFQDVIALGRAHAVYAKHGVGKSLFTTYLAARMATEGKAVVQYLDFEMTEADLWERLSDMGYSSKDDLSRLHYALLPSLPPLDTQAGADALLTAVGSLLEEHRGDPVITVVDTMSRAIVGEENSADTFRNFYRYSGLGLKQRGVTWMRLDHAGKDRQQGQRGSSSKGDDVDIVWRLSRTDNGIRLDREKARMSWVPETTTFGRFEGPLRYLPVVRDWPDGTASLANLLDRLGLPLDASSRACQEKLREIDEGRQNTLICAALRWRRERAEEAGKHPGKHSGASQPEAIQESLGSMADSGSEALPEALGSRA
jgi:KaiC/GvpD/RAD55 family RecA-like ATPase